MGPTEEMRLDDGHRETRPARGSDYAESDRRLRDELVAMGLEVMDTRDGTRSDLETRRGVLPRTTRSSADRSPLHLVGGDSYDVLDPHSELTLEVGAGLDGERRAGREATRCPPRCRAGSCTSSRCRGRCGG